MLNPDRSTAFADLFGGDPDARAEAPGRVNLIGEHTDYHHGYVLPTTIPQRTHVLLRRRSDRRVRVASRHQGATIEEYALGEEKSGRGWLDYVQGVTAALATAPAGAALGGFDAFIDS